MGAPRAMPDSVTSWVERARTLPRCRASACPSPRHDHHDRGVHLLLRPRRDLSARTRRRGERRAREDHSVDRSHLRRCGHAPPRVCSLRRPRLDARHDGHRPQPRPERRDRPRAGGERRRRALRRRQLPAPHPDVRRRGARRGHEHFDEKLKALKADHGVELDSDLSADDWRTLVERYKALVQSTPASPSRKTPTTSSGAPSARCSAPGATSAPSPTAASSRSPRSGAPPSPSRRWCSATWATTSATGVAFTRNPSTGENALYGEFLINAQGEDVVAGIAHPARHHREGAQGGRLRQAVHGEGAAAGVRGTPRRLRQARGALSRTCRTSSSPSSAASCGCCRPASASAPPRPR